MSTGRPSPSFRPDSRPVPPRASGKAAKAARIALAKAVLTVFGGLTKTKHALDSLGRGDVPLTTVDSWRRNGIPRWRWEALREAARKNNLRLPKDLTTKDLNGRH